MWSIALQGGGTKGAYDIGVFLAITDLGLDIDCVVGTSIGAINGALFAGGNIDGYAIWDDIKLENVIKVPQNFKGDTNLFGIKNFPTLFGELYKNKGLDISPFEKLLNDTIDEKKIRKSKIKFGLATYSLTEKCEKQLFIEDIPNGKLVDYLLASAGLPVFKQRSIDNKIYLDGGVINNLPVDMLINNGSKNIIIVSVGGIGLTKSISGAGCNFITIKCSESVIGTLDFDLDGLKKLKNYGYFDTFKAFGKCMGKKYYFDSYDYIKNKLKYSDNILDGIENAAEILEIDIFKIYKVMGLVKIIMKKFFKHEVENIGIDYLALSDDRKMCCIANAIINNNLEILNSKFVAGILGSIFSAASAIAYFALNIDIN